MTQKKKKGELAKRSECLWRYRHGRVGSSSTLHCEKLIIWVGLFFFLVF